MHDINESAESEDEEEVQKKETRDLESPPMAERLAVCEDCEFAFCVVCKKSWHGENARCSPRRQAELSAEEKASAEYFAKYSTPCPTCNAPAQKTMGCNHMTCFKCKTHFRYLCASYLMPENPYTHYNDFSSRWYSRLWELEAGDGEGVDRGAWHHPDIIAEWEAAIGAEDEPDEPAEPDLPPENFDAFKGESPFADEEESDDEEPAPDQRRNRNVIEIVNFARPGVPNAQVIELPERPRQVDAVPPQAPNAPRGEQRRGGRQQGNQQHQIPPRLPHRYNGRGQFVGYRDHFLRAPREVRVEEGLDGMGQIDGHIAPEDNNDANHDGPPGQLLPAAPGQGNQQAGPIRGMGLDRFCSSRDRTRRMGGTVMS